MTTNQAYWDDPAYLHITTAVYDRERDQLTVSFADGDCVSVAAWRLLRSTEGPASWDDLQVVEGYHIAVPVAAGTGDLGTDEIEIPGLTMRAITDPVSAAHLARQAEERARHVGSRVKALRQARGLSARDVAERVGMAQQHVSRIEQGRHAVSYATLGKLLAAMGYTLADVLPVTGDSQSASVAQVSTAETAG